MKANDQSTAAPTFFERVLNSGRQQPRSAGVGNSPPRYGGLLSICNLEKGRDDQIRELGCANTDTKSPAAAHRIKQHCYLSRKRSSCYLSALPQYQTAFPIIGSPIDQREDRTISQGTDVAISFS